MNQITGTVLMVRPASFGFNEETADNNHFQIREGKEDTVNIQSLALSEFDGMVNTLREKGVEVLVVEDTMDPIKPDAIFPNNWLSTHKNGIVIQYPMFAPNRRVERREDIVKSLEENLGFKKNYDFNHYEEDGQFLEGTGSMVLDRINKVVYACLSPRTNVQILSKFAVLMNYFSVHFKAVDKNGKEIYHTNVMMALGEELVILCTNAIVKEERAIVLKKIKDTGKVVVDISIDQMNQFAGNMLELKGSNGVRYMVMSESAYNCLKEDQIKKIKKYNEILAIPIPTIEKFGGGGVRCMMAEIFKPEPK